MIAAIAVAIFIAVTIMCLTGFELGQHATDDTRIRAGHARKRCLDHAGTNAVRLHDIYDPLHLRCDGAGPSAKPITGGVGESITTWSYVSKRRSISRDRRVLVSNSASAFGGIGPADIAVKPRSFISNVSISIFSSPDKKVAEAPIVIDPS